MRKIFAMAIVAGLTAALTGCGDDRKNSIPTVNKDAPVPNLVTAGAGGGGDVAKKAPAPTQVDK